MQAVDYKTKYGAAGGKVKVLPTRIPISASLSNSNTDKGISGNGTGMCNGSISPQVQSPMFRLPPPPKKPSAANKVNAINPSVVFNQIREPIELSLHQSTGPSNSFVSQSYAQTGTSLPPIPQRNSVLTHSLPPNISSTSNSDLRTKESEGMLSDMKKLQYELAQLKMELASITEPMKEHDEWLTLQSEQVKELAEQQKTLQTRIVSNGFQTPPKNEKQNPINIIPNPPVNNKKFERAGLQSPQLAVPTYSDRNTCTAEKLPSSKKTPMQDNVSPTIRSENSNHGNVKSQSQFDTAVNVRRISGLFEQNISSYKNTENSNTKRSNNARKSTGSFLAIDKSLEFEDRREEKGSTKALNRSKSMYFHKPVPSPKPIYRPATRDHSFSFNSAKEKIAEFHDKNQSQFAPKVSEKPNSLTLNKLKEMTPEEFPASPPITRPLPLLPKRPISSSLPKRLVPQAFHSNAAQRTIPISADTADKSPTENMLISTETAKIGPQTSPAFGRKIQPPPPPPLHNPCEGADEPSLPNPTQIVSAPNSPTVPTPIEKNDAHTHHIPPPPPLPKQIDILVVSKSLIPPKPSTVMLNGNGLNNNSQFAHSSYPHEEAHHDLEPKSLSTPPFTPPGTLNIGSSKADLLQQIRDFGNSGKVLKRASSVNSDGGTPQSPRKHVMHDALQTRFKAFCGNGSDTSESEADEDWDD